MICNIVLIIYMLKVLMVKIFMDLMELMQSDENIRFAYRNIKRNTGSKTAGYDELTIEDISQLSVEEVVSTIQKCLNLYPQSSSACFHSKRQMEKQVL